LSKVTLEQKEQRRTSSMSLILRILVTLLIFSFIFSAIDVRSVLKTLARIDLALLLFALVFQLISTVIASYRWHLVMQALSFGQDFPFYLRSYFKGMFFNQGLPTSIGGDALRVLDVARTGYLKTEAFYGVAVDRGVGLLSLLVLNLIAIGFNPDLLPAAAAIPIATIVVAGIVGFSLFYSLRLLHFLSRWRGIRMFHELSARLHILLNNWRSVCLQLCLGVLIHVLAIFGIYFLGHSVGLVYEMATFMVIIPPAILLTIVPISLAGWGVREGAMIGLFTLLGADKVTVLSMSILYGIVLIVISIPGLYVYITAKPRI